MQQYEAILAYQQADMEVVRRENTLKSSPTRRKLVSLHGQLVELTNNMQKLETDIIRYQASLSALSNEYQGLEAAIDDGLALVNEGKVSDLDYIRAMAADADQIVGQLTAIAQDVRRVQDELAAQEKQYRDMRATAVRRKKEFDELKKAVDEEVKQAQAELDEFTSNRDALEKAVNERLLTRYKAVKQHVVPPVAALSGNQCGGCNMSLPSVVVKNVNSGQLVECENCGRILFIAP